MSNPETEPDPVPGVKLRDFGDVHSLRDDILSGVHSEFASRFPIENEQVRLDLHDLSYDSKKSKYGISDAKSALMNGGRLAVPLHATVSLTDKATGRQLDKQKVLLANVPYLTNRGTFIIGGNEVTSVNQARLRSGVYARRKENGELESHINAKAGTGPSMRIYMEPETGVYRAGLGQATIKLYPVLNALGVKDEQLGKLWGPEILKANQLAFDKQAVGKFYTKFMGYSADPNLPDNEKIKALSERISGVELDPEVTLRTIGETHGNLSPDLMAKASAKLLKISKGEAESDDRDSLANKYFMSTDDFMREHVRRDNGKMGRALLWKLTRERNLTPFKPGYFTPQLENLLVSNSLSSPIAGINPMEVRDQLMRVVQTGEGGVSGQDSIPVSARNVHPSQAFFIDPIRSSESTAIGTDQRVAYGVKKGSDGFIYAPFRNKKTGKIEYLNPAQVSQKNIAFSEPKSLSIFQSNV